MFKRKKKKIGCETPTYSRFSIAPEPKSELKPNPNYVPPASVRKTGVQTPEIREWKFENSKDIIIVPKHDKLVEWKSSDHIPYKDEILVGYNDVQTVYKIGDGIRKWNELPEVSLEEALSSGYAYHTLWKYRIKLEFIPTRTMRSKENNKCKD